MDATRSLINTWKNCYSVSLGNRLRYKERLKELRTWDKPIKSNSINKDAMWEHYCKRRALEELLS